MGATEFLSGRVVLHPGDCREVVARLPENSIDSCVTDPPYALVSIVKRFGGANAAPAKGGGATGVYKRASAGFMGKQWDTGEVAFDPEFWAEVGRVLKPGAHLIAFSGTRTYHRMTCAIEDAGFEVRDQIGWLYGSGFPKSHNQKGEWKGWGTALKPAWEPIVLARKPLSEGTVAANVLRWGTGALNIGACRIGTEGGTRKEASDVKSRTDSVGGYLNNEAGALIPGLGRWPANVVHDGSDEVVGAFPDSKGQQGDVRGDEPSGVTDEIYGKFKGRVPAAKRNDGGGSAARFFYTAKADADDRAGSKHPTVKPVDLIRYLCRLITPPGGTVLDPFAGTGTAGEAAFYEGFKAVLIEREAEYQADIARRMALVMAGPEEKRREIIKASGKAEEAGPLFEMFA